MCEVTNNLKRNGIYPTHLRFLLHRRVEVTIADPKNNKYYENKIRELYDFKCSFSLKTKIDNAPSLFIVFSI